MDLSVRDRLDARAFLSDELYLRATRAEHQAAQEKQRADEAEAEVKRLSDENAVLRGEPNPS